MSEFTWCAIVKISAQKGNVVFTTSDFVDSTKFAFNTNPVVSSISRSEFYDNLFQSGEVLVLGLKIFDTLNDAEKVDLLVFDSGVHVVPCKDLKGNSAYAMLGPNTDTAANHVWALNGGLSVLHLNRTGEALAFSIRSSGVVIEQPPIDRNNLDELKTIEAHYAHLNVIPLTHKLVIRPDVTTTELAEILNAMEAHFKPFSFQNMSPATLRHFKKLSTYPIPILDDR